MKLWLLYGGSLLLTLFTLLGDCMIKEATLVEERSSRLLLLVSVSLIWALQPYGWYYIVREYTLFEAGVLFSAVALIGGCAIASLWYREPVGAWAWLGMGFTLTGMVCLALGHK